MAPRTVTPPPNLAGKTAIVTGSNSGIGYATASALASLSCHVVLACRNAQKAQTALDQIKAAHPSASLEVLTLDLASLQSARDFVDSWEKRSDKKIDLLICNGGATFVDLDKTDDGFERTYQTNFLTHFLLVRRLLPCLALAEQPRIVFVSSNAASWGTVSMDNLNAEAIPASSWKGMARFKTGMQVYGNSKLAQMLAAIRLQRLLLSTPGTSSQPGGNLQNLNNIAVHTVYPGFVGSEMAQKDHYKLPKIVTGLANRAIKMFGTSIDNGAKPTLGRH